MNTADFYDGLAHDYHLIATNWDSVTRTQGEKIAALLGPGIKKVLDCSCGIGTQAIGLALQGLTVIGTDLSPIAVNQATENANRLGVPTSFSVADMRNLREVAGLFDAVVSFDNSIAHLLTEEDLQMAFRAMRNKLSSGGILLLSLRDYEQLKKEKPPGMLPRRIRDTHGDRVYAQAWEWSEDAKYYDLSLFVLKNAGSRWEANLLETRMRAWVKYEIVPNLERAGFGKCEWLDVSDSSYYQPILRAKAID